MIRAFVTGWPVSHSLSPLLHGYWLRRYDIEGSYEAVPKRPDEIEDFLKNLSASGWAGGNVTIPHKEVALRCCARVDAEAEAIGAVNTVWIENGTLVGSNTDAYGFAANLDDFAPGWADAGLALVLGAGGAARAVVRALLNRGVRQVLVVNRTPERALALAVHFGARVEGAGWEKLPERLADADIVVNTTSLGMEGQPALDIDLSKMADRAVVADIVYVPLSTPFLEAARARGLHAVDGLGMLLHQAVPGFERWFGRRPRVDAGLRRLLTDELARRKKEP